MKKNKFEFIIDSEFQSQIPALTDEEFQQLEENILSEGEVLSPLIVWGNILVDAIKEKIGSAVDTSELEQQADAIKAQLRQRLSTKSRLEHQMDTLDFNDSYYRVLLSYQTFKIF